MARQLAAMVAAAVAVLFILGTGAAPPAQAQVESVLHSFTGYNSTTPTASDGQTPAGALIRDSSGNLYGTTGGGGRFDNGRVFEEVYNPSTNVYTEKVLYDFGGVSGDGAYPYAGVIMDSAGNLYGTTEEGGSGYDGSVFELSPPTTAGGNWQETVLYNFKGLAANDAAQPYSRLTMDSAGNLFGTSYYGGSSTNCTAATSRCGTVFELSPDSTSSTGYSEKVIHSFAGTDGANPEGGLILDSSGNLYGTTVYGGSQNNGIVFELSPDSSSSTGYSEKVLHSFTGSDGEYPDAILITDSAGNLYGTAMMGGSAGDGTVFELSPPATSGGSWTVKLLYSFTGFNFTNLSSSDGIGPRSRLIKDSAGNLYGTTLSGGPQNEGTAFEISPDPSSSTGYSEKVLCSFTGNDGATPYEGLVMDPAGNLYDTTYHGGSTYVSPSSPGDGTFFGIAPVTLSASSLSFGNVAFDSTSAVQTETITNIGGGKFSYSAASISGADASDFSVTNGCSTAVAPNGTCSVSVAFTPSVAASEAATLNLSQGGMTQTVSLAGTGIYPTASLSASSLTFSSQDVGAADSAQTVTVTNNSNVTLDITAVGITGDFAIASNNCSTVAPSGTCTVGVTFKPTAAGKRTGTLSFTDNASNSPQTVALSGTGEDFALAASTTSETVAAGSAATYSLQLSPEGGFNQAVSLACSGAPKGAACTVNPTSVTLDGTNSASFSMKVTTTGSAMLAPGPDNFIPPTGSLPLVAWLSLFGLLGLLALAKFSPRGGRIRRLAPLATLALLITFSVACGGGSSSPSSATTNSNATPAGTYTLTVTGSSGSLSHSTTVTMQVQ